MTQWNDSFQSAHIESAACSLMVCCKCPALQALPLCIVVSACYNLLAHQASSNMTAMLLFMRVGALLSSRCDLQNQGNILHHSVSAGSSAQSWLLDAQSDSSSAGACGRHPCHGCGAVAWLLTRLPLQNKRSMICHITQDAEWCAMLWCYYQGKI